MPNRVSLSRSRGVRHHRIRSQPGLVPLAAAYTAWARGRPGWAGIFSGLALAKPQLLLLVPVLFIARRSWRALAGFGAVIGGLGLVSVAGFGLGPVLGYVNAVGRWAIGGSLPTNGQIVYTDTAVYSLRNVLEAVPGAARVSRLRSWSCFWPWSRCR